MRKIGKKLLTLMLAAAMALSLGAVGAQPAKAEDGKKTFSEEEETITNKTGMFHVTEAEYDVQNHTLTFSLSGKGYHYLYKGTYEEAVAAKDQISADMSADTASGNLIKGSVTDNVWSFTTTLTDDEIGKNVPITAISNSYYTKYVDGKNALERAFYPRMLCLDLTANMLTAGDLDHTVALTVNNHVKMFKPGNTADLHTVGGPNSNNYKVTLTLPMSSTAYDKAYIGDAEQAASASDDQIVNHTDSKFEFTLRENAMGGSSVVNIPYDEEFTIAFHSAKKDTWYNRFFTVSPSKKTVEIYSENAADRAAADKAAETLNALPETAALKLDDKAAVEAARKAYDELTENQKALVPAETLKKLTDAETQIAALEKEKAAADKAAADKAKAEKAKIEAVQNAKEQLLDVRVSTKKKTMTVTFASVENADTYEVSYQIGKTKTWKTLKVNTASAVIPKVKAGQTVKVRVRAGITNAGTVTYGKYSATGYYLQSKVTAKKAAAGKKALTAKWNKQAKVSGYQIQYSAKKSFTGAKTKTVKGTSKTSLTIRKLAAKKTYYVRVRAYKTTGGKKYYGAWSAAKKVKTAK